MSIFLESGTIVACGQTEVVAPLRRFSTLLGVGSRVLEIRRNS